MVVRTNRSAEKRARSRRRRPIFAGALLNLIAAAAVAGPVLPTGARVVAGTAAVTAPSATQLTVTQSSAKAIIDWQGFSIGSGGRVQFNNGTGATLNRVTGTSVSSIDGLLSATGSVYLINANGVVIGKTGVVNTGGTFVASSLDVTDANFLAGGDLTFSGTSSAAVVNDGKIGSLGGDVALFAAKVDNEGLISAANGAAGLAAGYTVILHDGALNGGKFSVVTGGASTSATNAGAIAAAEAELRANGGNVYALAGNTGGIIKATGVAAGGGKVVLYAEGGTTTANGQIDAVNADGSGGWVETSGASVDFTGLKVKAANWLVDPTDLTVDAAAAATISSNLATTSVTLRTTASGASGPGNTAPGAGDINITAPISWSSANTLTLDAYHGITITAPITVSGAGQVALITNDGGTGGDYSFGLGPTGFAGSLSFTGTPGGGLGLTINGQAYTLLYRMTDSTTTYGNGPDTGTDDIAGIDHAGDGGHYAVAIDIDGGQWGFNAPPAGSGTNVFTGVFEGLGNTVSNVDVYGANNLGLFGKNAGGTIRDVAVAGNVGGNVHLGGLVGWNAGVILNAYASISININLESQLQPGESDGGQTGGLVGLNTGTVQNAYAIGGQVVGAGYATGGLIGANFGMVSNASASDQVIGVFRVGGLIGYNDGTITNVHATGLVTAQSEVGGLVGQNDVNGWIVNAYATGVASSAWMTNLSTGAVSISQTGGSMIGGLVGENLGTIWNAYATGAIWSGATDGGLVGYNAGAINNAYATGQIIMGASDAGGLVGDNSGTISNAYAAGAVEATAGAGGLVGYNEAGGALTDVYATGAVMGGTSSGGLVGHGAGAVTNGYWDESTTGKIVSAGGAGLTTAALQGVVLPGFSYTYWRAGAGLYPYLAGFFPNGVYAITGFTTAGLGTVDVCANGAELGAIASIGANGYYYVMAGGPSPFGAGAQIGVTMTPFEESFTPPILAVAYADDVRQVGHVVQMPTFGYQAVTLSTDQATWSATLSGAEAAFGPTNWAGAISMARAQNEDSFIPAYVIDADGAYTIDQALTVQVEPLTITTKVGNLTIAAPITAPEAFLNSASSVLETGGGEITTSFLTGSANGWIGLTGANAIGYFGGFTDPNTAGINIVDSVALGLGNLNIPGALSVHDSGAGVTIEAPVSIGGAASIQTQGAIAINDHLTTGGALQLYAFGGAVTENAIGGIITTPSLSGGGQGLSLPDYLNQIGTLAGWGRTGTTDTIDVVDNTPLTISGGVSAGQGAITIQDYAGGVTVNAPLTANGLIYLYGQGGQMQVNAAITTNGDIRLAGNHVTEGSGGLVWGVGLTLESNGPTALNGANHISRLLSASNTSSGGGALSFNDTVGLTVTGPITSSGAITLTSTASTSLILKAVVSTPTTLNLNGGGVVTEGPGGISRRTPSMSPPSRGSTSPTPIRSPMWGSTPPSPGQM